MKVIIKLKQWKQDNVRRTWDYIIDFTPPFYRNGVSHQNMSTSFQNGGSFMIDFQNSEQAENFMRKLVVAAPNIFDIGTTE